MSDEKEGELTHGFNIKAGEHTHALSYIAEHMSERQLRDMAEHAERHHDEGFTFHAHGEDFKLKHHSDGSLSIHKT